MKIRYNAPVTLTFALISATVLLLDQLFGLHLISTFFIVPGKGGFDPSFAPGYLRLVTHIIGHVGWQHLLGNFSLILLIGPILEEKYGSSSLLVMILLTALITGLLNVLFFPTALLGASGVAFMMILLVSFTNIRSGDVPLTFILILLFYLAREVMNSLQTNQISEFAHIVGGFCGSLFGFLKPRR
ncbi:rhomboid family intramembrane serine protease [Sediminispirochaeta bajacaliforniensis]|uniref:rhomboid family intramembrane serine protease n=1 Tax=Sediminispirochaeta bajacaliforniensis TaxID=148 RepID=UPI00037173AE|nr:rhomboid family intramembrane serine protease [Sediminispirochaeta bajacaliforniensis]